MEHLSDYVNPYVGTISHMLQSTVPEVMLPYGMARSTPVFDGCSDYYCNDKLKGYPLGSALVMPGKDGAFENTIDHSREEFRCYYLRQELEEYGITAESAVTGHVYLHRFTGASQLRLAFPGGNAEVRVDEILIKLPLNRTRKPVTQYVRVQLDCGVEVVSQADGELVVAVPGSVTVYGAVSLISFESAQKSLSL